MNTAVILEEQQIADRPIIEVNNKTYIEDFRGRLIPADQFEDVFQPASLLGINGRPHIQDAEGRWIEWSAVKAKDQLQDELVRKIIAFARDLSSQIERFRRHTENDLAGFMQMLEQEYGVIVGGKGGNAMLRTYDDLMRVEIKVGKFMEFGPELQIAKLLIDECLREWSEESNTQIRTLVLSAFKVDKKGKLDRQRILSLKSHAFEDDRWQRAMKAITDADRTVMVREYLHFRHRQTHQDEFKAITINLAKAGA